MIEILYLFIIQSAINMERYEPIVTLGNVLTLLVMTVSATITIVSVRWKIQNTKLELQTQIELSKSQLESKISILEQYRLTNKEAILDMRAALKEHITKDEIWQSNIEKSVDKIYETVKLIHPK